MDVKTDISIIESVVSFAEKKKTHYRSQCSGAEITESYSDAILICPQQYEKVVVFYDGRSGVL